MSEKELDKLVVVIPCFKAKGQINIVISNLISAGISKIIVVDDNCPDQSASSIHFNEVKVLKNNINLGVGGAFAEGCKYAFKCYKDDDVNYIAKIDADNQHRVSDLKKMFNELLVSDTDLVKGNRYLLARNPLGQSFIRKFGNFGLSFLSKLSSGYWDIGDPVNGLFVIRSNVIKLIINMNLLQDRFLFESSLIFACSKLKAKIMDCPNVITYGDEHSSLNVSSEIFKFGFYYLRNFFRRISREYFFPTFDVGAIGIILALVFLPLSIIWGSYSYVSGMISGTSTEVGIISIVMMSFFLGIQGLFFFLNVDLMSRKDLKAIYRFIDKN